MRKIYLNYCCALFLLFIVACDHDTSEKTPVNGVSFNTLATQAIAIQESFTYQLQVIAKDSARGNALWTTTVTLSEKDRIRIPLDYPFYSFHASKPGFISHRQYYDLDELAKANQLAFEFIPESLEGFDREQPPGNAVTFYLPNEANRCKLYARADFEEGYTPVYLYSDQNAIDRAQYPLVNLKWVEWFGELDPWSSIYYPRVNLHGNKPFNTAEDFCKNIDLNASKLAPTLQDVDISYYRVLSLIHNNEEHFISTYKKWEGVNNK